MPHKVLLIQGDPRDAEAVHAALVSSSPQSFEIEWVRSCSAGMARLVQEASNPHGTTVAAVLLDLFLPDCEGLTTFDRLHHVLPHVPMLILSAAGNEALAMLAVRRGAQDYLLRMQVDAYLLPKAIRSMIARAAALALTLQEQERALLTLDSMGDAVLSTDLSGNVTYLNNIAEQLTGWELTEATGRPLGEVLRILDANTREAVENPLQLAMHRNRSMILPPHCMLVARDGGEALIEDSTAPIRDRCGSVTGAVMVFRDVSAVQAVALRMSHLARHDCLTDLPNRVLLKDRLEEALGLSRRHRRQLAVLFLDMDGFKCVNDALGHAVGDRLLQSVTRRLLACVRDCDTVSRQGGDEFVILLSEIARADDASRSADQILTLLRMPHRIDEHELRVTASIGIATYPNDGLEAQTLLQNADTAMYSAKQRGRDNYQFFKLEMQRRRPPLPRCQSLPALDRGFHRQC